MLFTPILAGHWSHADVLAGRYTADDLFDIIEAMTVQSENEERAREAAERTG